MKFHNYLQEILGSKIKIQLLRTLHKFPDKGFGMRELASLLKVDHRSVSEAVKDFEKHNLVKVKVFGRSYAVFLNKESFACRKIRGVFEVEKNTLNDLVSLVKRELPPKNIQTCALFGSIVEKKEKYNSDIDLLIITNNKEKIEGEIGGLQESVLTLFGNPLTPLILTKTAFKKTNPQLRENILKNNLLVYGKW